MTKLDIIIYYNVIGDNMEKYYLFIIKDKYRKLYKNKSYALYKILENLYGIKAYDFSFGINIYNEICKNLNVKLLNNYFNNRINHKRINKIIKLNKENTYIQIMYPCVVIYTNNKFSKTFRLFNIYNQNIFACDFKNKKSFWLNKQV